MREYEIVSHCRRADGNVGKRIRQDAEDLLELFRREEPGEAPELVMSVFDWLELEQGDFDRLSEESQVTDDWNVVHTLVRADTGEAHEGWLDLFREDAEA